MRRSAVFAMLLCLHLPSLSSAKEVKNISHVTTEAQLREHVGEEVRFEGKFTWIGIIGPYVDNGSCVICILQRPTKPQVQRRSALAGGAGSPSPSLPTLPLILSRLLRLDNRPRPG